jgi:excinuclease ABC subunit A
VTLPLDRFVCVTGVSGSGKSTLIEEVLYRALRRQRGDRAERPGAFRAIRGGDSIADVILVDQSPIGRSPRANPATYVKAYDGIRRLFAAAPVAVARGYGASTFSFNVDGGRCEHCSGDGFERIEMQFLSDVYLPCPVCGGRRFQPEIMDVRVGGRNILEVLDLTVNEAIEVFAGEETVARALAPVAGSVSATCGSDSRSRLCPEVKRSGSSSLSTCAPEARAPKAPTHAPTHAPAAARADGGAATSSSSTSRQPASILPMLRCC